jgi:hypothetical protein
MRSILDLRNLPVFGALLIATVLVGCEAKKDDAQSTAPPPAPPQAAPPPPPAAVAPRPAPPPPVAAAPQPQPAPPAPPPTIVIVPQPAPVAPIPPRPAVPAVRPGERWVLLGQRQADFKMDRDRIVLGRSDGTFRELRFTVQGAPVEMYDMVVTFGNGQQFKPNVKWIFDERTSSRTMDLPGERRAIKQVDFVFRSPSRREGKATVSLYGR